MSVELKKAKFCFSTPNLVKGFFSLDALAVPDISISFAPFVFNYEYRKRKELWCCGEYIGLLALSSMLLNYFMALVIYYILETRAIQNGLEARWMEE